MTSKITLTAFVILLITTPLSMADPIVQKQNFSGITGFPDNLTFNKFNAGGTLTSVKITLNLQITCGSLIIDNDSNDPIVGTFEFGINAALYSADVSLTGGPIKAQALNSLSVNLGGNYNDGDNDFSPDPPDGCLYNGSNVSDKESGLVSNLTQYEGSDTYNIAVLTSLHTEHDITGKFEYRVNPYPAVNGYVEVIYTYDPIPEPATICLLGFGALSLLRRKK